MPWAVQSGEQDVVPEWMKERLRSPEREKRVSEKRSESCE
jgi:hypothetical protein